MQILLDYIQENRQNAILYKAHHLLGEAGDDIHLRTEALEQLSQLLAFLPSDAIREDYIERLTSDRSLKIKVTQLKKRIADITSKWEKKQQELAEKESAIPSWIEKEKFYTIGFDWKVEGPDKTGFYFHTGEKGAKRMTNFVIRPLIHVYSKDEGENRRLTEIDNGIKRTVLELPAKAFTSADQFESILMNEGVYFTMDGFAKSHLNKLKATFLPEYPKCFELKTLGWQPEGFWAYYNKVWHQKSLIDFNEYGFTEVNGTNYLSMAFSSIQSEVRSEDDLYKNDKYLKWVPAQIDFAQWAELMAKVYGKDGWIATVIAFVALFRDVVFEVGNYCPHLYAYGAVQSGKSKYAESLSNLFFAELPAFNLNQGTDYAFWSRLGRFRNCPVVLNEFDENAVKEEWFRAIKSAADGEGREKGIYGSKKKTTTMAVECFILLIGQFLSTKDDASVLSRSIPRAFKENNNRPPEQVAAYEKLKALEKQGLSGVLTEMLTFRKEIAEKYAETFYAVMKEMTASINADGVYVKIRIQQNFCVMLAMAKLVGDKIKFPFTYDEFYQECKNEIMKLSNLISDSDSLASFWKMAEFLLDQGMIEDGFDFKIEMKDEVPILISRSEVGSDGKNTKTIRFDEPKRLLYLRLNNVHPLYMSSTRTQTGKTGLNQETIVMRLREQPYFIGNNKASSFRSDRTGKSTVTNSYVFDYDMMNVNLVRNEDAPGEPRTLIGEVKYGNAQTIDVLGIPKCKFTLVIDESYEFEGQVVRKDTSINCYWTNIDKVSSITVGSRLKVTGMYSERGRDRVIREMHITELEFASLTELKNTEDWTTL